MAHVYGLVCGGRVWIEQSEEGEDLLLFSEEVGRFFSATEDEWKMGVECVGHRWGKSAECFSKELDEGKDEICWMLL